MEADQVPDIFQKLPSSASQRPCLNVDVMQLHVMSVRMGASVHPMGPPSARRRDVVSLTSRSRPPRGSSRSFAKGPHFVTRQHRSVTRAIMDDMSDTKDLGEMCDTDLGFCELWENEMVAFWRSWNDMAETERHKVRDVDIRWLVKLGRVDEKFSKPDLVFNNAKKLSTLLPDANVPNMLQREPNVLNINFVRASQSILELQSVLCSSDRCQDVTPVIERHPRLLLCEDVVAEVDSAKARLQELAPSCDASKAISEYPELIYRIHNYGEYSELPISIQNIILETSNEEVDEILESYNSRWDDWERERGDVPSEWQGMGVASKEYQRKGLDGDGWMNESAQMAEAAEWMLDGYHDPEEED